MVILGNEDEYEKEEKNEAEESSETGSEETEASGEAGAGEGTVIPEDNMLDAREGDIVAPIPADGVSEAGAQDLVIAAPPTPTATIPLNLPDGSIPPVRVSKIVMQGFKSFQRRTAIPIFPGFNGIIGPNGAGKSNILDAICFVLGRSSRGLRAGRLEQIIFNGGGGSKPADYALVEMHVDNSRGIIVGQEPEIVVSRRVNRQGVSVYKLSGKITTREQIVDVLRQGAIDPDGHNIIQQGDITDIIERKPKERREVLDEIAGVREYQEKKDKAMRELDTAQKAVDEATAVLRQKEEFLNKIRRERDLALKHQEIEQQLQRTKANLAYSRMSAVENVLENIGSNLEVKEKELTALVEKVNSADATLDQKENGIKKIDRDILNKSVNAALRSEIEKLNSQVLTKEGQMNANRREIERIEEMIDTLLRIKGKRPEGADARVPWSVRAILNLNKGGVLGTVSQLYKVDGKYETAIEVAAGSHLNDVVVDSERTALDCISHLKNNNLGRVRFLPLDRIRTMQQSAKAEIAAKQEGVIDFAINLIKFEKTYDGAFKYVLSDTLVVQNAEAARKIKGLRLVTLEGELFEAGGAIIGGSFKKKDEKDRGSGVAEVQEYESALKRLRMENENIQREISELEKALAEKRKAEASESEDVKELESEREGLSTEIDNLKRGRREEYERRILLETEVQGLKMQKVRAEAERDGLSVDFAPYKEAADRGEIVFEKGDAEKLERESKKLERQMRDIGLINMKAIEEFDVFNKDYEGGKEKLEQLYAEKNSINAMIEKLEEKRKIIFNETLIGIAKEFSRVFSDLIGGNAELSLENPNDIESGLLIKAQPAGKTLVNIDSLSGGEKSLTALAFLFAVLRHKAAPFYLLDEIDAALDKENSEKIGNLIKNYAVNSQFIVITHNDITARRAERIYGVSMQKGVSQVLGMKF